MVPNQITENSWTYISPPSSTPTQTTLDNFKFYNRFFACRSLEYVPTYNRV